MVDYFRQVKLFSALPPDIMAWLDGKTSWTHVCKGDYIFYEGEPAEKVYIVGKGSVKVVKEFASGKNAIMGIFGPGGLMAEVAAVDGKPYPASGVAMEDSYIGAIPSLVFCELLRKAPESAILLIRGLGAKLREFSSNLGSLAVQTVEKRLARFLHKLAQSSGVKGKEGLTLNLSMTRRDLAEIIGTSFEVVERSLKKMRSENIISVDGKTIVILDPKRLEALFED